MVQRLLNSQTRIEADATKQDISESITVIIGGHDSQVGFMRDYRATR